MSSCPDTDIDPSFLTLDTQFTSIGRNISKNVVSHTLVFSAVCFIYVHHSQLFVSIPERNSRIAACM